MPQLVLSTALSLRRDVVVDVEEHRSDLKTLFRILHRKTFARAASDDASSAVQRTKTLSGIPGTGDCVRRYATIRGS